MTATTLLSQLTELGINVTLEGETIQVSPKSKLTPTLVSALRHSKQDVILLLQEQSTDTVTTVTPVEQLRKLEALAWSGQYEGANVEELKAYLWRWFERGDTQALDPLMAYLEREDVQKLLWTVN